MPISNILSSNLGCCSNLPRQRSLQISNITAELTGALDLIAFLALFVRVAGNHLWSLFCYVYYQWRAIPGGRAGLFHQSQLLLRGGRSDFKTAIGFFRLGRAWRGKATGSMCRVLPLVATGLLHVVALGLCGIFSSRVAEAHSNVLLKNGTCGKAKISHKKSV